jgi:hypothetical protein
MSQILEIVVSDIHMIYKTGTLFLESRRVHIPQHVYLRDVSFEVRSSTMS